MRCRSCFRTFSQPSKVTKDTQVCSICRGTKTRLKYRELCEKSPRFLINSNITNIGAKKIWNNENHDRCFIEHLPRTRDHSMVVVINE